MKNYPPPSAILDELPDYFLGCLIYYDNDPNNNMKWVCYDGRDRYRCITRSAAESCAKTLKSRNSDLQIGHLQVAYHFLFRAWHILDKAAVESDVSTRLFLEMKAVEVRKIAMAIIGLPNQNNLSETII